MVLSTWWRSSIGTAAPVCQGLSQETIQNIKQGMAREYLKILEKQAMDNGGITSTDINAPDVWGIHEKVFNDNGLSIENWTLNAPFKILQQLGGDQLLEEFFSFPNSVWECL